MVYNSKYSKHPNTWVSNNAGTLPSHKDHMSVFGLNLEILYFEQDISTFKLMKD